MNNEDLEKVLDEVEKAQKLDNALLEVILGKEKI